MFVWRDGRTANFFRSYFDAVRDFLSQADSVQRVLFSAATRAHHRTPLVHASWSSLDQLWTTTSIEEMPFGCQPERLRLPKAAALCQAFASFDTNGDGTITRDEFIAIMQRGSGGAKWTIEQAATLFTSIDTDQNGTLGYLEFVCYMSDQSPRKTLASLVEQCAQVNVAEEDPYNVLRATVGYMGSLCDGRTRKRGESKAQAAEHSKETLECLMGAMEKRLIAESDGLKTCKQLTDGIRRFTVVGLPGLGKQARVVDYCLHFCRFMDEVQEELEEDQKEAEEKLKKLYALCKKGCTKQEGVSGPVLED